MANPVHMLISTILGAMGRSDWKTLSLDDLVAFRLHVHRCGYRSTPEVEAVLNEFNAGSKPGDDIGKSVQYVISTAHYVQGRGLFTLSEAGRVVGYIDQIVKMAHAQAPAPAPTPPAPSAPKAPEEDDDIEVVHIKRAQ